MAGLYLHIPFCNNKCLYCDFFSGNQLYLIDDYVDALNQEMIIRQEYIKGSIVDTIYFGGGTPSILSKSNLTKIIKSIYKVFKVNTNAEITIECNPENINAEYIEFLKDLGVNRISLGIQFFNDLILEKFNRNHTNGLIKNALEIISDSHFLNLSVDMIYSVPGINDEELYSSLQELMKYNIKHVSAYSLTIAKNSQLYWKIKKGALIESNEDQFLSQYKMINDFLQSNSYIHYEISNYALKGYYSHHNLAYWNQVSYLGLGVSAHSYNLFSRQWNHTNIKKYVRELNENESRVSFEIEQLTEVQLYNEYLIKKMRTFQGLSISYIKDNYGDDIVNHFFTEINFLKKNDHFVFQDDLIIPKESDLLISDYLTDRLMYG